jgi:hypothetical protein
MKTIVFICIPIIILSLLSRFNILPGFIYYPLLVMIFVIAIIYLFIRTVYLTSHDNMNYKEYDWNFNLKNAPPIDTSTPSSTVPWTSSATGGTCIGQECCASGETYDSTMNKCSGGYGSGPFGTGKNSNAPLGSEAGFFNQITGGISNIATDTSQSMYQARQNFMATSTSFS